MQMGQKWDKTFGKAIELDGWGQVEEAREIYDSLSTTMQREADTTLPDEWTEKQTGAIKKLIICLRLRSQVIKRGELDGINSENMKSLRNVFENLFKKDKKFPLELGDVAEEDLKKAMGIREEELETEVEEVVELIDSVSVSEAARARQRPAEDVDTSVESGLRSGPSSPAAPATISTPKKPGKQVLLHVEKIGLKDYDTYVDPYVSVSVVSGGKNMESWQDTAIGKERSERHIIFGDCITLKSNYESILPGAAVLFELKHFKEKKSKISTKCWAFLEREDLKEGRHMLELYKKPTDLKRKKLSLLSIKELYLNVRIEFKQN